jgi:hypothetical protein
MRRVRIRPKGSDALKERNNALVMDHELARAGTTAFPLRATAAGIVVQPVPQLHRLHPHLRAMHASMCAGMAVSYEREGPLGVPVQTTESALKRSVETVREAASTRSGSVELHVQMK